MEQEKRQGSIDAAAQLVDDCYPGIKDEFTRKALTEHLASRPLGMVATFYRAMDALEQVAILTAEVATLREQLATARRGAWISVEDRLPEEDEYVLALNTFNGLEQSFCEVVRHESGDEEWVWFGMESGRWSRRAFGYGMPLPDPPQSRISKEEQG